jgi:hypothetical protein
MRKLETSSLHRGVVGARHSFLPLPPAANKLDLLIQVRGPCGAGGCAPRGMGDAWTGQQGGHLTRTPTPAEQAAALSSRTPPRAAQGVRLCPCLACPSVIARPLFHRCSPGGGGGVGAGQARHGLLQHPGQLPRRWVRWGCV